MKRLLASAVLLLLFTGTPTFACECATKPDASKLTRQQAAISSAESSDVVFVGRVEGMQSRLRLLFKGARYSLLTLGSREISGQKEDRILRRRVRFGVVESLRGQVGDSISIFTGWGGGDCGYPFVRGESYIVFGRQVHDEWLYTGICDVTAPSASAHEEIDAIRSLEVQRLSQRDDGSPSNLSMNRTPSCAARGYRCTVGFTMSTLSSRCHRGAGYLTTRSAA